MTKFELLIQNLSEGTEEKYNLSRNSRCPGWDLKPGLLGKKKLVLGHDVRHVMGRGNFERSDRLIAEPIQVLRSEELEQWRYSINKEIVTWDIYFHIHLTFYEHSLVRRRDATTTGNNSIIHTYCGRLFNDTILGYLYIYHCQDMSILTPLFTE